MNILIAELDRFQLATKNMKELLSEIDEDIFHKKPSEKEWSVAQIASHVKEAILFWLDDIRALQIVPEAKWGRNMEHVRRLAAVADRVTENLTPKMAIKNLDGLDEVVTHIFTTITEDQLKTITNSYNPNFDGKPLSFIVEHLIVTHAEGHYDQMVRHLAKVKASH
ncbi:MAG: DinB family protein [Kurthia sp.]|nr:DinB family protein [Candidatus Kurthia equi]